MKKQLPIVTWPQNKSLHERCRDMTADELSSAATKNLIRDMIHTMYKDDGVGIAAPQVGVPVRLAIIAKTALKQTSNGAPFSTKKDLVIINPVYTPLDTNKAKDEEGCLSTPGVLGSTQRHTKIFIQFMNLEWERCECVATGFLARIFQHEIDHLDGVLFVDRASETHETKEKPNYPVI